MKTTDKDQMLEFIDDFPNQVEKARELASKVKLKGLGGTKRLVLCGVNEAGIVSEIFQRTVRDIGITVIKDFFFGKTTNKPLVIINSYSGNSEEMISCLRTASKFKYPVLGITSGGFLMETFEKKKIPYIKLPENLPARTTLTLQFFSLLYVLTNAKIIQDYSKEIQETENLLKTQKFSRDSYIITKSLGGKMPIIYSGWDMKPAAYRFKCQLNENAKQLAFANTFPEAMHNELESFRRPNQKIVVVFARDNSDADTQKYMELFKRLFDKKLSIVDIRTKGRSLMAKIFTFILLTDYVSYYMALMNKVDPSEMELKDSFKKSFSQKKELLGKPEKKYKEVEGTRVGYY